jgi:hypothetical protein
MHGVRLCDVKAIQAYCAEQGFPLPMFRMEMERRLMHRAEGTLIDLDEAIRKWGPGLRLMECCLTDGTRSLVFGFSMAPADIKTNQELDYGFSILTQAPTGDLDFKVFVDTHFEDLERLAYRRSVRGVRKLVAWLRKIAA